MSVVRRVPLMLLALSCTIPSLLADEPHASYIFPAGGRRGATVTFVVGGHNLHQRAAFEMLGHGVDACDEIRPAKRTVWFEGPLIPQPASQTKEDYPKDYQGQVSIHADAPLGIRRWRVTTSQGATLLRPFLIGDLPEIIEQEIDGDPIPVDVEVPLTINGRIFPREDVDIWTLDAVAGQRYVCEVMAARLNSPLDSRLAVFDPAQQLVAENLDHFGADSCVTFVARESGPHQVHIHDVNFGGLQDYVYRLTIRGGPLVEGVFPLGGRQGAKARFQLFGQGLVGTGAILDLSTDNDEMLTPWADDRSLGCPMLMLQTNDLPEHVEADAKTLIITEPSIVNGAIDQAGQIDIWHISGSKGDERFFDLYAARLGSPLDAVLRIRNADGKQLAQADDLGIGQTDAQLRFTLPADGTYAVEITDRFDSRGGPHFAYRLHITEPPQPDFELQLPADALTVPRGGQAKLKLAAVRTGGCDHEIKIICQGLPAGVTVTGNTIGKGKKDAQLVFTASDTATIRTARVQLIGTAKIDDRTVERSVRRPAANPLDRTIDHLLVAVAMPTPFKVIGQFETRYAAQGSSYERHYTIDRGGFRGPITIRMADRQVRHLQGVTGPTVVVPADKSEFSYRVQLAPQMEIGRTCRVCLMAVGEVKDSDGSSHTVSYTSHAQNDQTIVLVDPGQLAVRVQPASLLAIPGQTVPLQVEIGRGAGINGPVRIDLILPEHFQGIEAEPVTIQAGQGHGQLRIHFSAESAGPVNMPLKIRATAIVAGHPYIAETKLDVVRSQE